MKKLLCVVLLVGTVCGATFAVTGDGEADAESDPITAAIEHAQIDGRAYEATGWGWLGFGMSFLVSPLFGGGGVIIAANLIDPRVDLPVTRMATARQHYGGTDLLTYQAQYRDSMADPVQRDRSRRAWVGTGIGFGVRLVVVVAYVSLMSAVY